MKAISVLFAALTLAGCVSVRSVPTSQGTLDRLRGRGLTVVTYKTPDFLAQTYGKAVLGVFGALAMISDGNEIIAQNNVPDPAQSVSARLVERLAPRLAGAAPAILRDRDSKEDTQETLSSLAKHDGVILDVETINWMFLYFPFDWSHYRVIVSMRARLIDAQTGQRLAQAPCAYLPEGTAAPTYDEMLGDHAAKLKAMLAAGADFCLDKMSKDLLGS